MPAQLPLALPHSVSLARDDLIVSASNRLSVEAMDSWPNWHHSILLVVGPAGSGKSHLLNAWIEASGALKAEGKSEAGVEVGMCDLAGTLQTAGFRVAIDDIDRCDLAEDDLFAILNAARLGGGTVLATARTRPQEMALRLADLRSRLGAATLAELGAPDDALLAGVLAKLFADRQLNVSTKEIDYLTRRMDRSLDAARRLVAEIDTESLAGKQKISPRLLKRVLDREAPGMRHQTVVPAPYPARTED